MDKNKTSNDLALEKFAKLIVKKIEEVSNDYEQPWFSTVGHGLPQNLEGNVYNGINFLMLFLLQEEKKYQTPVYMTYLQAKEKGVRINRDESAFPVFYRNFIIKDNEGKKISMNDYTHLSQEEKQAYTVHPYTKVHLVFNIDQTNYAKIHPEKWKELQQKFHVFEHKNQQEIFCSPELDVILKNNAWLCPILSEKREDSPYYSSLEDKIYIPLKEQYKTGEAFYSDLLHEMAHSTGIDSRLGREVKNTFGDPKYAKEELIAELTAAVSCHSLGIISGIQEANAKYLKNWLEAINQEPKFLFSVLGDVGKASAMILNEVNKLDLDLSRSTAAVDISPETAKPAFSKENNQFCYIERTYREEGSFSFTGKEKIQGPEDIAYIFRQLEDYSVENAFAVLVKEGKPTIIHIGMGTLANTNVDVAALKIAYDSFDADQIYFVHNHPSGALKCSTLDMGMLKIFSKMFPGKVQDGIIINTISGKYGIFNIDGMVGNFSRPKQQEDYPLKLYSFNKMVFSPDYDPTALNTIYSKEDVAALVSSSRLGTRQKISYLILNTQNHIIANIHTSFKTLQKHEKELANEMVSNAIRFAGSGLIVYGDFTSNIKSEFKIKDEIKERSGNNVSILDFVIVQGLYDIQKKEKFNAAIEAAQTGNFQTFMELEEQGTVLSETDIQLLRDKLAPNALTTVGCIFKLEINPIISTKPVEKGINKPIVQLSLNF